MARFAVVGGTLALVAVAGCAPTGEPPETLASLTVERWCYETLAEVDCTVAPQPDAESRRVGWYDEILVVD
jgi:hypothetical protein